MSAGDVVSIRVLVADDHRSMRSIVRNPSVTDPDVIICDLRMETMVHEVSRQVGVTAVLAKPISADQLLKQIHTAIGFSGDAPRP